ncbi:hypothetical protein P3T21_005958 [Paraburkholderia sp. GAS334]
MSRRIAQRSDCPPPDEVQLWAKRRETPAHGGAAPDTNESDEECSMSEENFRVEEH